MHRARIVSDWLERHANVNTHSPNTTSWHEQQSLGQPTSARTAKNKQWPLIGCSKLEPVAESSRIGAGKFVVLGRAQSLAAGRQAGWLVGWLALMSMLRPTQCN